MRPLNRITPQLPAHAMQTHHILAPVETHWRAATCEEVGCLNWRHGWMLPMTGLDEGDLWQLRNSGRRFREEPTDSGPVMVFEAGQPCLKASTHRIRIDRPELYVVQRGDWRIPLQAAVQAGQATRMSGPDAWVDHMHTHLERVQKGR